MPAAPMSVEPEGMIFTHLVTEDSHPLEKAGTGHGRAAVMSVPRHGRGRRERGFEGCHLGTDPRVCPRFAQWRELAHHMGLGQRSLPCTRSTKIGRRRRWGIRMLHEILLEILFPERRRRRVLDKADAPVIHISLAALPEEAECPDGQAQEYRAKESAQDRSSLSPDISRAARRADGVAIVDCQRRARDCVGCVYVG